MNKEKLTAVTNKICELLKGSSLDPMELRVGCYIKDIWDYEDMYVVGINERCLYACNSNGQSRIPLPVSNSISIIGSPIREAEVLAALNSIEIDIAIMMDGELLIYPLSDREFMLTGIRWQLGQPLSSQPTEVIEFLFNILVK